MSLPDIRFAQGRFEEAEKLLKEKVVNYSKYVMREDNIDLGRFAFRYAQCLWENGKAAEAIKAMEAAADFYRKEWAPGHPRVLRCLREIEGMRQTMPSSAELQTA
jgi:tetratricopeptide (TPR) repeat protein